MSKPFAGVPAGRVAMTSLPNVLFSEVLPEIDDLSELQVTLHVFYLLYHKKGSPRLVTANELLADTTLYRALAQNGRPVQETLNQALEKAVARRTLLQIVVMGEDGYLFNTAESRRALERIERGEMLPELTVRRAPPAAVEPPNIFKLYERNIGALTPLIAEELKEAEKEYPPDVILDAFRIATENNVRKWSYIRAILSDGTREGKHEATGRDSKKPAARRGQRQPHFQGKLIDSVKRRDK